MTFGLSVLAGLDDVPWDSLEHAYGPAGDVPELLRALASGDEEQADAALSDLYGTIWHQGSVYPATVPAVPFLVQIAASGAAGGQTSELVRLLGYLAASTDPRGIEDGGAVRSAVGVHTEAVAALLENPEPRTRAAALFVLVYAATADRARPLVLGRWYAETEALPRAEVLNAMMRVDPETAADLAEEVLSSAGSTGTPDDSPLRVSCALAWIHAGRALDGRVLDAALAPIPGDSELWHWNDDGQLFGQFVRELAERQGVAASVELVAVCLERAREAPTDLADQYLSTARGLITSYRSAPGPLAAPLVRLLDRADLARRVIGLLELISPAVVAPVAGGRLVRLAQVDGEPGSFDALLADDALACLAGWGDPVVPGLLARAVAVRPRAVEVVAGLAVRPDAVVPFDSGLLVAIRRRLNEICDAAQEPAADGGNPFAAVRDHNEPGHLAKILTAWGDRADAAEPELVRLLAVRPVAAASALAGICGRSLAGMAQLRRVAATADDRDAVRARLAAAQAVRTLTGDSAPLLAAVRHGLTLESKNPDDRAGAAEVVADLLEHADVLVPLLHQALRSIPFPTPSLAAHQARMKVGRAVWLLTGQPEHAIEVVRGTLDLAGELFTAWTVATAADLAAELGTRARELATDLEPALDDYVSCPAAVRALLAVDPEGPWSSTRREELVDRLVGALVGAASPAVRGRALDVLSSLMPLSGASAGRLRAAVDRDERFLGGFLDVEHIRGDDLLQERMRGLF